MIGFKSSSVTNLENKVSSLKINVEQLTKDMNHLNKQFRQNNCKHKKSDRIIRLDSINDYLLSVLSAQETKSLIYILECSECGLVIDMTTSNKVLKKWVNQILKEKDKQIQKHKYE